MNQGWIRAAGVDELRQKGRIVFRLDGRQIALFDTAKGIYACNNRCPHEGYPLREGTLDGNCLLTCNWHNWKFDLETGENQRAGDRLRVYPVEIRGADVWIEIVDPPVEERLAKSLKDLKQGFDRHGYDRLAREIARIARLGVDPAIAVREAIRWSHDRLEFGWTHAYAGAADWLALYDEHEDEPESRLICLLEAVGHMADDTLRRPRYPYADGAEDWDEDAFVRAVEDEDEARAIRLTRGALATGDAWGLMERGLARAALAHYADFGHAAIYVTKAGALIRRLGGEVAGPVLLPLVRGLVTATREDLIPEFRAYADALQDFGSRPNGSAPAAADYAGLSANKAVAFTAEHGAAPPLDLYRSLLGANALNMVQFDLRHLGDLDKPYGGDFGWLDLTHGLTFAEAVLGLCSKFPELWPAGLLQMACFSGRNTGHQDDALDPDDWTVADPDAFFAGVERTLLDHGQDRYIVSVHLLKTALSVRSLLASGECGRSGELALAALNRLLRSPLRRKMVRRTARQAMRFVEIDI
ncbi:MAG: Rieske 2Fe-2S domain-containing protein [Rhodospirillaceae bacterium]|nr:Rieske 2Fe-2S domain-containing protein [Rhodospirillaceae bacterium]